MTATTFDYLESLGTGTSGTVYRAKDRNGREVAVKIFRDTVAKDPTLYKRFKREIDIATQLEHENLVATYEGGKTAAGKLFLATELLSGGDVHRLLERAGPLSEAAALSIAADLLRGLAYLHSKRLVHRDVKPENILLSKEGIAKLSDFGLAKVAAPDGARVTATGEVIGTPYYLAPEQIRGEKDIDVRADLYSTGAVLFELLCGKPPFEGPTVVDILAAHLRSPVPDLAARRPGLQPGTVALVAGLLEKDRAKRPADPAAVAKAAEELLARLGAGDGRAAVREVMARQAAGVEAGEAAPRAAGTQTSAVPTLSARDTAVARFGRTPRIKITLEAPRGALQLFAFAGERVQLGRDGIDKSDNDICLRVRGPNGVELSKKIDSRHMKIDIDKSGAYVRDLEGPGGTRLNGQRLLPNVKAPIAPPGTISLSGGALELEARVVPGDAGPAAVIIRRPNNSPEQVYALIRDRLIIGSRLGVPVIGASEGSILAVGEGGFTVNGRPIAPGARLEASGLAWEVEEIRPEDMK